MRKTIILIGLFAITGLLGCASTGSMRSEPLDAGAVREFSGDYAVILRAARDAIVAAGLAIDSFDEVNETTAMIIAKKGASLFSWGELVRVVVVQQSPSGPTQIRVVSDRKLSTNVTAKGDYADTIFSNVALALR